jgi:3-deoxy-7-phosphoheptulonate synthase
VGADGLMVEVHNHPELALSDGAQALTPSDYAQLIIEVRSIHRVTTPIVNQSRIEAKVA